MSLGDSWKGKILETHTRSLFESAVIEAAVLLRAGEVVALPTETVYGLAANALDEEAVAKLFAIKGRPVDNPIIVHVGSVEMACRCVLNWPDLAERLAMAFWPGPLTMVLPRAPSIPANVSAGLDTVGVRWPNHPLTQAVIDACGFPLAAPSANFSSEISPTTAEHVKKSLGDRIALIVDGGPSHVGIESTVVDLSVYPPAVLRPGMIQAEALLAVTGNLSVGNPPDAPHTLRSPGMLPRHYAPKSRLVVWSWSSEEELEAKLAGLKLSLEDVCVIAHSQIPPPSQYASVMVIPHDAEAYARAIYAELHRCDEKNPALIVLEALPDHPDWAALHDRMVRASESGK